MQHYVVQAIIRGRIADSQIDEAIETLTRRRHPKGMHAIRLPGRSVIRDLTFLELELLVKPDVNAHDLAALVTETLVTIANENTSGDNEAQWERARDILARRRDSSSTPDEHRNSHKAKTYELLYAEGYFQGYAERTHPLTPLQTSDPAQNAHRADVAETWQALLEPFKLFAPIRVGKLT